MVGKPWSWWGAAWIGTALVVWIAVQIQVIGYDPILRSRPYTEGSAFAPY